MMDIDTEWDHRKDQFFELWPRYKSDEVQNIWGMLTRYYSEDTRFYHTREHILDCLNQFGQIKDKLTSGDAVQMSIWFHDVIYDIGAKDNEEKSANFFSQISKGILTGDFIKLVAELIVSTKHITAPANSDQAYLLDIDLSSFGSRREKFHQNGKNLRKEVPHLTDEQFTDNQINFLQMLLNRKQIFFTDYFHERYETIARRNINNQMQELLNTDL